ncbi:unnamed protein product, partial [Mesorhabditis belari]|uniref:Protein kinase domain-containing protein n=1 Tax=Mesorhabditis belari TaxID=2138241 RepID=A0AAF3FKH1_9BILA
MKNWFWILIGAIGAVLFIVLVIVAIVLIVKVRRRKVKPVHPLKRSTARKEASQRSTAQQTAVDATRETQDIDDMESLSGSLYSPQPWKSRRIQIRKIVDGKVEKGEPETPKWNISDPWQIDPSDLRISSRIGRGDSSEVFFGEFSEKLPLLKINSSLENKFELINNIYQVAVKMPVDSAKNKAFLKEIEFMKEIGYHENLLSMVGCSSEPKSLMILTEFCGQGNLQKLLRGSDKQSREFMILKLHFMTIARQIADALAYLVTKKIVHRDVAARNVLLTKKKKPKLCDFGMSRHIDDFTVRENERLPLQWIAPEVLEFGVFSEKSDVWSFGILLWEMYTIGGQPHAGVEETKLAHLIIKGNVALEIPEDTPEMMHQLMLTCWKPSSKERPTFEAIAQILSSSSAPEKLLSHF